MAQHMESLHVGLSLSQRKHGEDDGNTDGGGGGGGGPGNSSGGGGPGPGSQTPTSSPPQATTVTTVSTSTRTFVSISTMPVQGNTDSSSNGPTPTPGPVRAPPSPTQSGPQSGSVGLKVAPTTINQDTSSPATSSAPGSSPSSGGSPPPSSNSSSSIVFVLNSPTNTTVCDSLLLSWSYVGQSPISLTLAVQAQNSPFGDDATASPPPPSQPRILSTNISSSVANYHWNPVDVKEGWYNAHAYDTANSTGISASSSPFFVAQGSNTTCLLALGPTQSSTPTALPPTDSTHIPIGDIVGIALGVTAGVLGLITAFVLPRMRKRPHDSKPLLDSPKIITKKKWPRLLY